MSPGTNTQSGAAIAVAGASSVPPATVAPSKAAAPKAAKKKYVPAPKAAAPKAKSKATAKSSGQPSLKRALELASEKKSYVAANRHDDEQEVDGDDYRTPSRSQRHVFETSRHLLDAATLRAYDDAKTSTLAGKQKTMNAIINKCVARTVARSGSVKPAMSITKTTEQSKIDSARDKTIGLHYYPFVGTYFSGSE